MHPGRAALVPATSSVALAPLQLTGRLLRLDRCGSSGVRVARGHEGR
jgi:hypothetical protein